MAANYGTSDESPTNSEVLKKGPVNPVGNAIPYDPWQYADKKPEAGSSDAAARQKILDNMTVKSSRHPQWREAPGPQYPGASPAPKAPTASPGGGTTGAPVHGPADTPAEAAAPNNTPAPAPYNASAQHSEFTPSPHWWASRSNINPGNAK